VDHLRGLKENVIVGRLIPAGTGMPVYREVYLEKDEPVPVQPNLEDLLRAQKPTTTPKRRCRWQISTTGSRFYFIASVKRAAARPPVVLAPYSCPRSAARIHHRDQPVSVWPKRSPQTRISFPHPTRYTLDVQKEIPQQSARRVRL